MYLETIGPVSSGTGLQVKHVHLYSIIKKLVSFTWPNQICMNVNFPDAQVGEVGGVKIASQGELDVNWKVFKKFDPVERPYYWLRAEYADKKNDENSDVILLEKKKMITVTPLQSRHEFLGCTEQLEELFASNI